jgi:hypothetical protein
MFDTGAQSHEDRPIGSTEVTTDYTDFDPDLSNLFRGIRGYIYGYRGVTQVWKL